MDEQLELSLVVANNLESQEAMEVERQILPFIEQQVPIVFCGGRGGEFHNVNVCLVPNGLDSKGSREILTVFKVHSSRLSRCSKYFETCMAERWTKPSSTFLLETQTDIATYTDCFSRMYSSPFLKDFKGVESSLKLLKVASQIQFHELMDSILLYISSKLWSDAEELMIKLYSSSSDFPRSHAQDLVVRLGTDESEEDCHGQVCDIVEQLIRSALGHEGNVRVNRAFFEDMLSDEVSHGGDFFVKKNVITIACTEAKDMLVRVAEECDGKTYASLPGFADKILAICWILETLLTAKVAEQVVQFFVHLQKFPKILAIDPPPAALNSGGYHISHIQYTEKTAAQRSAWEAAVKLGNLVLRIYKEVAAGDLLLKTPERVALLENWHSLIAKLCTKDSFDKATKELFATLPLSAQIKIVKLHKDGNYEGFICTNSLAKRLSKEWPALEVEYVVPSPSPTSPLGDATVSESDA